MKLVFYMMLITLSLLHNTAFAETNRFFRLTKSSLFENLTKQGDWKINISKDGIDFKCQSCERGITARLEIIKPYREGKFGSVSKRYIAERKNHCVRLLMEENGRCLGVSSAGRRGLEGLESRQERVKLNEIELVLFYAEKRKEGEMLRTRMSFEGPIDRRYVDLFWHQMLKLTLFY